MAANRSPSPKTLHERIIGLVTRYWTLMRTLGFSSLTNASSFLIVLVTLLAARLLGREDFGTLAFAQSLAIIIMAPVSFGVNQIVVREVSRQRELGANYLFNHVIWSALLAIFLLAAMVSILLLTGADPQMRTVIILTSAAWALRLMTLSVQVYFRPFDHYGRESLIAVGGQGIYLLLCLSVLILAPELIIFVVAILVARILAFVLALAAAGQTIGIRWQLNMRQILRIQWLAVPIGISIAINTAYTQVDLLVMRWGLGFDLETIGVYGAAIKVYLALSMVPAIIGNVLLPRLSVSSIDEDYRRHRRLMWGGGLLLLAISLPIAATGSLCAPWIMSVAFGADYAGGAIVMQVLFLAAPFTFQTAYAQTLFVVIDRQKVMAWIMLLGLVVRVALVWSFSTIWSIEGAAFAVLASEATVMIVSFWYLATRR